MKKNKGITLIALIITIIILLILAVVTIAAISGDGDLISHANNAKAKYTEEASNENIVLGNYLIKLDEININESANNESKNKIYYLYDASLNSEAIIEEKNDGIRVYAKYEEEFVYTDEPARGPIDISNGITLGGDSIDSGRFPNGMFYVYFGSLYLIKEGNDWWYYNTSAGKGSADEFIKLEIIDSYDTTGAQDIKSLN